MLPSLSSFRKASVAVVLAGAVLILPRGAFAQSTPAVSAGSLGTPLPRPRARQEQPPLSPQVQALVDRLSTVRLRHATSVENFRREYLFYATLSGPPEPVFHVENRTIPGAASGIPIRVYAPRAASDLPVFVFFHGGGFVAGSLDTHDTPLRAVTNRCGCLVVSVGYRLAPENRYPAAPDDAYAATKWIAEHAREIGADPDRVAVGGDGAGGNLAAVVALMARDRGGPHLTLQVLIYPILDALMGTYSWTFSDDPVLDRDSMSLKWSAYLPVMARQQVPYVSPASSMDFRNLPPAFIVGAAGDPVRDTVENFATDLIRAGVPVKEAHYRDAVHSFFLMAGELDAAKMCIDDTSAVLRDSFWLAP